MCKSTGRGEGRVGWIAGRKHYLAASSLTWSIYWWEKSGPFYSFLLQNECIVGKKGLRTQNQEKRNLVSMYSIYKRIGATLPDRILNVPDYLTTYQKSLVAYGVSHTSHYSNCHSLIQMLLEFQKAYHMLSHAS